MHVLEGVSEITIQRVTPLFNLEERAKGDHIFSQVFVSPEQMLRYGVEAAYVHQDA